MIPAFDRLDEYLNKQVQNTLCQPAIRAACSLAKKTLNHYYQKTDDAWIFRISMGTSSFLTRD